jgi:hypothetical protein
MDFKEWLLTKADAAFRHRGVEGVETAKNYWFRQKKLLVEIVKAETGAPSSMCMIFPEDVQPGEEVYLVEQGEPVKVICNGENRFRVGELQFTPGPYQPVFRERAQNEPTP